MNALLNVFGIFFVTMSSQESCDKVSQKLNRYEIFFFAQMYTYTELQKSYYNFAFFITGSLSTSL